jgi:hypothetical protein
VTVNLSLLLLQTEHIRRATQQQAPKAFSLDFPVSDLKFLFSTETKKYVLQNLKKKNIFFSI